ncbi:unnamed protein product, partial [Symbiodinium microadriaticum]
VSDISSPSRVLMFFTSASPWPISSVPAMKMQLRPASFHDSPSASRRCTTSWCRGNSFASWSFSLFCLRW